MDKTMNCLWVGLLLGLIQLAPAAEEEGSQLSDKGPSRFKEKVVEARAEKHKDTGGVSKSGSKYVYVDQKDIEAITKAARTNDHVRGGKDQEINIGTTAITKDDKNVRRVDVVVKTDKKIDIRTDGQPVEVNIGRVTVEEGALKHQKLNSNIIIDADKGIVVH
jgi:hypothetical protein